MAPVLENSGMPLNDNSKQSKEGDPNLWATILSEVQSSSSSKLPSNKTLVVLGDNESGKTTLVAKLQGMEDSKKGAGLEYYYIDVRDEYRDDHTWLGVYVLDGEPSHSHLLKFCLSEKNISHTTVMICLTMAQPWNILESLNTWATILQDHIYQLKVPSEQFIEWQQRIKWRWQDYVEVGDEVEGATSPLRRPATNVGLSNVGNSGSGLGGGMDDNNAIPLPENVLTQNLGLDLIVVITKTDFMSNLEKEHDYKDEHFDFIQQAVRKFCLTFGAALFYTSVKEDKNCDLLYKYLVHRIYGFPFHTPALIIEKDAVFIPSGWDSENKIGILYENMTTVRPDDIYSDVIMKPVVRKPVQRDVEVQAEDEQIFLVKQQSLLNQQSSQPGAARQPGQDSPMRPSSGVPKDRKVTGSPGVQPGGIGSPKKPMEGSKTPGASEGVLANFFNSLLSKKSTTGPQTAVKQADKMAARSEVAAELNRMSYSSSNSKQPPSGQNSPSNSTSS